MHAFTTPDPTMEQMLLHLRQASDIARAAMEQGHHPFGALLVGPDHETVLLIQGNVDSVNHAEAVLARQAAAKFDAELLWNCTLYTTVEPCCMCSGTQYWAGIGRLVYGMSETRLRATTGRHQLGQIPAGLAVQPRYLGIPAVLVVLRPRHADDARSRAAAGIVVPGRCQSRRAGVVILTPGLGAHVERP